MSKDKNTEDRSTWAIGGGLMMGVGVGFILFTISVFYFIGSIMIGLGLGLLVTSILSSRKGEK